MNYTKVNINNKPSNSIKFKDLELCDWFLWRELLCIKTYDNIKWGNENKCINTIVVDYNLPYIFIDDNEQVIKVKEINITTEV